MAWESTHAPLSDADAERIAAFLRLEAPPDGATRADLAFVFGTRLPAPTHAAADLFRRGVVRWVVLTGGANRADGMPEAAAHEEILVREGIPRDRLIVERRSANTFENVRFALPLIARRIDLVAIRSVVVVAKWYHCRRAAMTLKCGLPAGVRYFTRTYAPDDVPREGWHRDAAAAARVLKEWEHIPAYLGCGQLAEIERSGGAFV